MNKSLNKTFDKIFNFNILGIAVTNFIISSSNLNFNHDKAIQKF